MILTNELTEGMEIDEVDEKYEDEEIDEVK